MFKLVSVVIINIKIQIIQIIKININLIIKDYKYNSHKIIYKYQ